MYSIDSSSDNMDRTFAKAADVGGISRNAKVLGSLGVPQCSAKRECSRGTRATASFGPQRSRTLRLPREPSPPLESRKVMPRRGTTRPPVQSPTSVPQHAQSMHPQGMVRKGTSKRQVGRCPKAMQTGKECTHAEQAPGGTPSNYRYPFITEGQSAASMAFNCVQLRSKGFQKSLHPGFPRLLQPEGVSLSRSFGVYSFSFWSGKGAPVSPPPLEQFSPGHGSP